ncbi:uncharacterized protein LOC115636170 isoform X2 [Gopherus evgoodei]|uniref:uncharacterized protein LOC115636170 isoform X2 n=1 Tax=Gopherus evgoodei TaxID=1825980 RepID=UPI0011CEF912|nr:uncharacterized protein LOC115636170 isoform X2 [Gopherus evgoodei]
MLSGWVQGLSCRGPSLLQSPPHLLPGAVRQCSAGSMVLNGPSARQARPCLTTLPGVAIGAGGQRRGWCKSLTSNCSATRGVKRSAAAPLPSMLPSGWSHTGCSVTGPERPAHVENMARLCQQHGIPLWVAPILEQAATMKCDKSRRHKAYRLIRRRLVRAKEVVHVTLEDLHLLNHPEAWSAQPCLQ